MNTTGLVQSKWCPKGFTLTLHGTRCVHTSMNLRKWNSSLILTLCLYIVFSSPEPKAHWWAYKIGRPPSSICVYICVYVCMYVVCMSTFSNIFSSETTGPIEAKFQLEPPRDTGKFIQRVLVTWPMWTPCPYMVKTLKNLLLRNWMADEWNFVCNIGCSSTTKFVQMMTPIDLDLFYDKVKFGPLCFSVGKR